MARSHHARKYPQLSKAMAALLAQAQAAESLSYQQLGQAANRARRAGLTWNKV